MNLDSRIWDYLKDNQLTDEGAAGLIGNLYAESGLQSNCCEKLCLKRLEQYGFGKYTSETYTEAVDSGVFSRTDFLHPIPGKQYGYGLAQWTTQERKALLYDICKKKDVSISDLDTQLEYLVTELKEKYPAVWSVLISTDSVDEASDIVLMKYEMPENPKTHVEERRDYSQKEYLKFHKENNMSGFDRQKVIDLARSEEGYLEKSTSWWKQYGKSGLYDKKAGAGSDNYTKYGYEMHVLYPEVMDFPAPWCDAHVDWLFMQAYGVSNAKKLLGGNFDDYTVASAQLYKDKNAWKPGGVIPEAGWQIFFKNSTRIYHTGLVLESVKKDGIWYVITSEGNTSSSIGVVANGGCVRIKQYTVSNPNIAGYGVPPYDDEKIKEKIKFVPHWVQSDGKWFYRIADGVNAHGWKLINNHWYLFAENGVMATGLVSINDKLYLLATKEMNQDFEGACCRTTDTGEIEIWNVTDEG